jgi:hypothetical protein
VFFYGSLKEEKLFRKQTVLAMRQRLIHRRKYIFECTERKQTSED